MHTTSLVPRATYGGVFIALEILTLVTAGVAYIDLGVGNTVIALAIAVTKMSLILLFFMHLRTSTRLTWAVVIGSFFWFGILVTLALSDYFTRGPGWLRYG